MSDQGGSFAAAVAATGRATADRPPAPQLPPKPASVAPVPVSEIIDTGVGLVDMRTGEVIDLSAVEHEFLAGIAFELRRREAQLKQWREAAEAQLLERHGERTTPQVVGDLEVNVERKWARDWDADELQGVLDDLVDRGVVDARTVGGLIRVASKVDGHAAQRLLNRLEGEALEAVNGCFAWKEGRPKVLITPIPDLADALPKQLPESS